MYKHKGQSTVVVQRSMQFSKRILQEAIFLLLRSTSSSTSSSSSSDNNNNNNNNSDSSNSTENRNKKKTSLCFPLSEMRSAILEALQLRSSEITGTKLR